MKKQISALVMWDQFFNLYTLVTRQMIVSWTVTLKLETGIHLSSNYETVKVGKSVVVSTAWAQLVFSITQVETQRVVNQKFQ